MFEKAPTCCCVVMCNNALYCLRFLPVKRKKEVSLRRLYTIASHTVFLIISPGNKIFFVSSFEIFHQSICTAQPLVAINWSGAVLCPAGTSYCIVIALDWERAVRITKQHNALSLPLYITVGCVDWCVGSYININSEGGENCHNVTFIIMWNRTVCDQEKRTLNQKQV